jgi:hypothetical protein
LHVYILLIALGHLPVYPHSRAAALPARAKSATNSWQPATVDVLPFLSSFNPSLCTRCFKFCSVGTYTLQILMDVQISSSINAKDQGEDTPEIIVRVFHF